MPGLTIRIQDATGSEDSGWLLFKVKLSRKHDDYVCYDFETISGGTATEGTDYLKFPKATYWMQIGKTVDKPFVRIIDDSEDENPDETVKVKISNAHVCNDASQTISITRAEATGTITETSASGMDSSDDGDGDDALLARVGDVTPEAATAALFGGDALTGDQLAAMDQLGNRNGAYDLGDLLSWRARCHRNEVSCGAIVSATDAGSVPASPAMPPTKRNGRTPPGGGEAPVPGGAPAETWAEVSNAFHSGARCARVWSDAGPAGMARPSAARPVGSGHWLWVLLPAPGAAASGIIPSSRPSRIPARCMCSSRSRPRPVTSEPCWSSRVPASIPSALQGSNSSRRTKHPPTEGRRSWPDPFPRGRYCRCGCRTGANLPTTGWTLMQVSGDDYGLKDLTQYGIAISR